MLRDRVEHDDVHLCPYCANEWLLGLDLENEYHHEAEMYEVELARRRTLGLPA
jgi:hypothetical protein